jgi:hypothetical protein
MILTAFIANFTAEPGLAPLSPFLDWNSITPVGRRQERGEKLVRRDDDETPLVHISLIARGRMAVLIVPSLCSVPIVAVVPVRRISFNTFKPFNRCATFRSCNATCFERQACRCLIYMDLNIVRAGVVNHPEKWKESGFIEIQKPPKRYTTPIRKSRLAG